MNFLANLRFTALGAALAALAAPLATAQTNLISNGTFEGSYSSGVATGWSKFPTDTRSVSVFEESSSVVRGGTRAQKMSLTRKLGGFFQGPILSTPINASGSPSGIVQGRDYEARIWVRSDRRELQDVALAVDSADWWQPSTYAFVRATVGQDWKEIVLRFRAAQSDTSANLAIRLAQEGTLWVDDASIREIPANETAAAPAAGNLLANGSFEVGFAGWRSLYGTMTSANLTAASSTDLATIGTWGAGRAAHGTTALTFTKGGINGARLESWPLTFAWKQPLTFSVCLRANSANTTVSFAVGHRDYDYNANANTPTNALALATSSVVVGTTWVRHQFTFTPPPVPNGQLYLVVDLPSGGTVTLDAAMLEPGNAASPGFVAKSTVEAGIVPGIADTGVIASGENYVGTLRLFNAGTQPANLNLRRQTRDVWGAVLPGSSATWTQAVAAGAGASVPISVNPGNVTGTFRVEVDLDGTPPTALADDLFTVLPAAPSSGQNASIGTHVDFVSPDRGFMRAGGVGWTKTWYLTWGNLESSTSGGTPKPADSSATASFTNSQVTGANGYLNSWKTSGLKVLAILGNAPSHRQNRPSNGGISWKGYPPLNYAALTDYVTKVATQFGSKVDVWELENEPDHFLSGADGLTAVEAYAKMALAMVKALRAVQPNARVLLGSATTDNKPVDWIVGTFNAQPELRDLVDGVSYHNYDSDPNTTRTNLAEIRSALDNAGLSRLEIWDTEWAPLSNAGTFSRSAPAALDGVRPSSAVVSAALAVQGHVTRLGEGAANSFLYHAYGPKGLNDAGFNMTRELNNVALPLYSAQAVVGSQLRGVTQPQRISATGIEAYRFLRPDGRQMIVAWANATQSGPVNYTAPFAVTVADMMGNTVGTYASGASVSIPPEPVYLLGSDGDLQLHYGETVLFSGDTAPTIAAGTDFGSAEVGSAVGGVTRVFTLKNVGTDPITLTGSPRVALAGNSTRDFTVENPPAGTLAAGASVPLRIRYQPLALGNSSVTLTIPYTMSGGLTATYRQKLAGIGGNASASLQVSPQRDSATLPAGTGGPARSFQVTNVGRASLTWNATLPTNYTAIPSGDADGPTYSWVDLESLGATDITPTDITSNSYVRNTAVQSFDASDPGKLVFPFYGKRYAGFRVSTSGFIYFGTNAAASSAGFTAAFPLTWNTPCIAVFGSDHYLQPGIGRILFKQMDADTWVITWLNVSLASDRTRRMTFQVILRRDGSIVCQYQNVVGTAMIGVTDTNSSSLTNRFLAYNRGSSTPSQNSAVLFLPPVAAVSASENYTPAADNQGGSAQWATISGGAPGTGVAPAASQNFTLTYNATNLDVGLTYRGRIRLSSNDAVAPDIYVPVALTVGTVSNQPPAVALAPLSPGTLDAPANVTLTANASDADGTVSRVQFYRNNSLIGIDYTAPFSVSASDLPVGTYVLTARAYDDAGGFSTSEPQLLSVSLPANEPPTAQPNVLPATVYTTDSVSLGLTLNDPDGSILRVDYYANGTYLGSAFDPPFGFVWNNPPGGNQVLTAEILDSGYNRTTVQLGTLNVVNAPPSVQLTAPANNAFATAPASVQLTANATDTDGNVTRVEFYQGTTLLGNSTTAPYAYQWSGVSAGNYTLTARAYDNNGASTDSSAVIYRVYPPGPRSTDLLAFWRLDETGGGGLDLSGNNRTLTLDSANNVTWRPAGGKFAGALDFAGVSGNSSATRARFAVSGSPTTFTFAAWVQVDGYSATLYPRLLTLPAFQFIIRNDGQAGLGLSYSPGTGQTSDWYGAATLAPGATWYHVAVTYDHASGNGPTFYLNGTALNRFGVAAGTAPAVVSNTAYLGNRADGLRPFDGRMDHVRLYSKALSAGEIAALAAENGAPSTPANLTASGGANRIDVQWDAATGGDILYRLERATSANGTFSEVSLSDTRTYSEPVTAGTTYWYRVQALSAGIPGMPSNAVSATALTSLQHWRNQNFGNPAATGNATNTADPDGDGLPNLLEYAIGQSPLTPAATGVQATTSDAVGSRLRLRFQRIADPALRYEVEAFSDFASPQTIWSSEGSANAAGEVIVEDSVDHGPVNNRRFLRLKVTTP